MKEKNVEARVETTNDKKNNNIVIGDPTKAKAVFCAHYDTPAMSPFPNIMIPKNRVLFYAYQFVPIICLLVVSLLFGWIVGEIILHSYQAFLIMFMVAYYGMFFGIMRGFTNKYNYNDNTSGVATVLSIIDKMPSERLSDFAFILFDNEEKGKKGSAAYFKDHKDEMKERFLINFDCVGNGKNIIFIAQEGAINSQEFKQLKGTFENTDEFTLDFCTHKEAQSNSDHKNFPYALGISAYHKGKSGHYIDRIHTPRDTNLDITNINLLRAAIISLICRDAAQ
jgi:hypothetical protein